MNEENKNYELYQETRGNITLTYRTELADICGFFMEEPSDDLLGIKIKRSNQTIEHRDYKDRNKYNLTNN